MKESRKFECGRGHFNARRFFEAHEVWEELWLLASEPERPFLQGLIQVAAAFHHYRRGNLRGTKSLLAAGVAKLDSFPENHSGIAVGAFRDDARRWIAILLDEVRTRPKKLPRIAVASHKRPAGGRGTFKKSARR
jgi:uncharacterized protein